MVEEFYREKMEERENGTAPATDTLLVTVINEKIQRKRKRGWASFKV